MLLDDLQEARVVDVAVLLQLLDLVGDGVEPALEVLQPLDLGLVRELLALLGGRQFLEGLKGLIDAAAQLLDLLGLKPGDLFELDIEDLVAEAVLVVLGPRLVLIVGPVLAQDALELAVVDVLVFPRRVRRLAQRLAEAHADREEEGGTVAGRSGDSG